MDTEPVDSDEDGIADYRDLDSDNGGIGDHLEVFSYGTNRTDQSDDMVLRGGGGLGCTSTVMPDGWRPHVWMLLSLVLVGRRRRP